MRVGSEYNVASERYDADRDNGGEGNASSQDDGTDTGTDDIENDLGIDGDDDDGGDEDVTNASTSPTSEQSADNGGDHVAGDSAADFVAEHDDNGDGERDVVFSVVYEGCFQDGLFFKDLNGGTRLFREVSKDGQPSTDLPRG